MVVRGRVAGIAPTAMVDLGKPAYRLGITELQVGRKGFELNVQVVADKPVYQTRDTARYRSRLNRRRRHCRKALKSRWRRLTAAVAGAE